MTLQADVLHSPLADESVDSIVATDVVDALRRRHNHEEWAFFTEIAPHTGWAGRWIDALAMNLWHSNKYFRISYEVKVSRSDFLRELKHPGKRQWALKLSNEFYFAAPKGMIKPEELPEEAGLIEITQNGAVGPHKFPDWGAAYCLNDCGVSAQTIRQNYVDGIGRNRVRHRAFYPPGNCPKHPRFKSRLKVKAPKREAEEPSLGFIASVARQIQRQYMNAQGRGES